MEVEDPTHDNDSASSYDYHYDYHYYHKYTAGFEPNRQFESYDRLEFIDKQTLNKSYTANSTTYYFFYHFYFHYYLFIYYYLDGLKAPFDDVTLDLIELILRLTVTSVISVFGIVTNVINVIVFYRQGILAHSSTVSLSAMAVSDFFLCLSVFWGTVSLSLVNSLEKIDYKWAFLDLYNYTSLRPELMFSDISSWLTAFVAFERLFSVALPFKVKAVFTPKRSCTAICCMFIGLFIFHMPNNFEFIPVASYINNSILLRYEKHDFVMDPWMSFYSRCRLIFRISVIIIVVLCNVIISWTVNVSQKFKKSTASTTVKQTVSPSAQVSNDSSKGENKKSDSNQKKTDASYNASKEMKLLRMITVICTMFIVCYSLDLMDIILFRLVWAEGVDYHWQVANMTSMGNTCFSTINASCNIIIYYVMSTRYKQELDLYVCGKKR